MIYKTVDIKPMQRLDRSLISIGSWLRSIDTQVVSFIYSDWKDWGTKDVSFHQHQYHSDIPEWTYQRNTATRYQNKFLKEKKWYQHLGLSIPSWHTSRDWRSPLPGLTLNPRFGALASQDGTVALSHVFCDAVYRPLGKNTARSVRSYPFPSIQLPEGLGQFWATSYQLSTALAVLLPIAINAVQAPKIVNLLPQASFPVTSGAGVKLQAGSTNLKMKAATPAASQSQTVKAVSPVRYALSKPTGRIANIQNYTLPAKGDFTSAYGMRWGRMHRGIDIAGPIGTPIVAAAGGKVLTAGWGEDGFGNKVEIQHPDGTITLYAHTSRVLTRVGAIVQQGQQIAEIGSTGSSTGPHLHFQIHPGGKEAVDPLFFFAGNKMLAAAAPDL
jgi:murein DD-endopeptidase MepM/ murein hydrolase activator NlpD